jgi:hypothetical protein
MGRKYNAFCPCGYTQDVSTGGNRNNHLTVDLAPFVCKSCKSLFSSNRRDRTHPCTHCAGIDTSSYRKGSLKQYRRPRRVVVTEPIVDIEILEPVQERPQGLLPRIWHWFFPKPKLLSTHPIEKRVVKESPIEERAVRKSEDQGYFCPRCKKFTLSFEQTAFTD